MVRLQLRFLWIKPYYTNVWLTLKFLPPANEVWGKVMFLPAATKLGQGNVFTGVCDSVNREGGLPQCMLGYHSPWEQTPPPGSRHTHTPRTRLPPWEQTHPLRDQTPLGADTPWSRPSLSTSGRYASYWNAFLLHLSVSHAIHKGEKVLWCYFLLWTVPTPWTAPPNSTYVPTPIWTAPPPRLLSF